MSTLSELHHRIVGSKEYDRMLRSVAPMCDYFNINQFYYARIQVYCGQTYYSVLATNLRWQEFLFNNVHMIAAWPVFKNPDKHPSRIILKKNTGVSQFNNVLDVAWNTFNINFTVDIQRKIPGGIELYGFGVNFLNPKAEEYLINELPLLNKFIAYFQKENKKIVGLAYDHQVEISSFLGPTIIDEPIEYQFSKKRELLLEHLGFGSALSLSSREMDILKFMANGFSANYVGHQLHISSRTVENHIANIKSKLDIHSKVNLIKKAQEIVAILNLK